MVKTRNPETVSRLYPLLYKAYLDARKNKRGTLDEQRFERYAPLYLAELADEIKNRKYHPSYGIAFIISKPVVREIFAAPFRDRIVHHLIFNLVGDWWDRRFIYDNYSCRVGKGTLMGVRRLQHHMAVVSKNYTRPAYVLKLDLSGYFMSLPRKRIYERAMWGVKRQFAADSWEYKMLRYLWREIIFDDPTAHVKVRGTRKEWAKLPPNKSMFHAKEGCGIVIGNLTSQLLSNIYLDQLDRFVTQDLGIKQYGRYVDDFYIVAANREELKAATKKIEQYLIELELNLHPRKRYLQEINHGVPFLGAIVYPYRLQPGLRLRRNYMTAARRYQAAGGERLDLGTPEAVSMTSYRGLAKHIRHHKLSDVAGA